MSKVNLYSIFVCAAVLQSSNAVAIQIEFDYRFDTGGFFTDQVTGTAITARRQLLDTAASYYAGFTDQLSVVNVDNPSNSWTVSISHPSQLGSTVTLVDEVIAANTIKVFVGGSTSFASVLGFAGTGYDFSANGTSDFIDSVTTRGQGINDYGVWGGSIWFNANNSWYFGADDAGLTVGNPDFLTTAIHEIGHILGFGEAESWFSQIDSNGLFTGENSIASYGSAVPVDQYGNHWGEGITSLFNGQLQETMMDPTTPAGLRQLPTDLDYAGFADIGWEVTAVPLPASLLFFLPAISGLFVWPRRKRLA